LSEDVARVLRAAGCANVRVAAAPDQASLLAALEAQ
jgi:uroporphyrinogen-III synthase